MTNPIDYDVPAITAAERQAMSDARAHDHKVMAGIRTAARALVNDVRRRHPGEELTCPHMRALDAALEAELEIDRKVLRNIFSDVPDAAEKAIKFVEAVAGD